MVTKVKGVAKRVDLTIEQGTTFDATITWKKADGSLYDLTGYKARMYIKRSIDDTSPVTGGTVLSTNPPTSPYIVLGGTAGTIRIVIPSDATAGYDFTTAVYDLEVYKDSVTPEEVFRPVYGYIILKKEVTK